jgi:hypothetical protein
MPELLIFKKKGVKKQQKNYYKISPYLPNSKFTIK